MAGLGLVLSLVSAVGQRAEAATFTVRDDAVAAGLYEVNESWSARAVDADGDGCQDVWVGNHDEGAKLYRGNCAGGYTRVAAGAWPRRNAEGKIPDRHECDWADVDHNGLPDAACAAGRGGDNLVKTGKDNELWRQTSAGTFVEQGTQWSIGDLCGRSHYLRFVEANGDGWVDLVVGNAPPRPVGGDPCDNPANGLPNEESKLFLNMGGQRFQQAPASFGIGGNWGVRCLEVVDWDRDGRQDLLTCGEDGLRLYRNNAGTGFTNIGAAVGLNSTDYSDAELADLDGDGDLDLVAILWDRLVYRLNGAGRLGAAVTMRTFQGGRALALGDADGSGSLDVYVLLARRQAGINTNDVLLLNAGLRFTALAVPPAGGMGDAVVPLDGDGNGRAEFLVLNGQEVRGPVQLIRLVPSA